MKVRAGIEVSGQSDIGCLRKNNEDSFGYWEPEDEAQFARKGRLAIVADGMGGYEGGQEASRLAVDTLIAVYRKFPGDDAQQALNEGLQAAHDEIRQIWTGPSRAAWHGDDVHGGGDCAGCALLRTRRRHPALPDSRRADYPGHARPFVCGTAGGSGNDQPGGGGDASATEYSDGGGGNKSGTDHGLAGHPEPLHPEDVLVICSDGLWGLVHDHGDPQSGGQTKRRARGPRSDRIGAGARWAGQYHRHHFAPALVECPSLVSSLALKPAGRASRSLLKVQTLAAESGVPPCSFLRNSLKSHAWQGSLKFCALAKLVRCL